MQCSADQPLLQEALQPEDLLSIEICGGRCDVSGNFQFDFSFIPWLRRGVNVRVLCEDGKRLAAGVPRAAWLEALSNHPPRAVHSLLQASSFPASPQRRSSRIPA